MEKNKLFKNLNVQFALGLSAASALIYEVVATKTLYFYFTESSYSIATVLSVFLFGLGIGSLTIYYLADRVKDKRLLFGVLQLLIALYAFLILSNMLELLPDLSTLGTFVTSFAILLVPTIFLGAIFPLAGALFKKEKREVIGLVYSIDLFGAIIGSLVAGFVLIPQFGVKFAAIFGAALNIISALIMFSKKLRILPTAFLFIVIISTISFPSLVTYSPSTLYENNGEGYQFYANSPYGLVTVLNGTLSINGREQCCMCYSNETSERMMVVYALDPLEKYGDLDALNIGLGCGLTLEKCLTYNTTVDVVEINEQVVRANRVMTDVLDNPRVNLILNDGLSYLRNNEKRYDSILIDIEDPDVAHSSNLYTVDAFEIIGDSLKANGTFSLWTYVGSDHYYDILCYSLKEVFPYVYEYPGVFLASKQKLSDQEEYVPHGPYEINTIDRNTLTDAYLEIKH